MRLRLRQLTSNRLVERVQKGRVTKWFKQERYRSQFECLVADLLVFLRSDKNDGNLAVTIVQLPLKIESRHTRHGKVENKAFSLLNAAGCQELFRRCERSAPKPKLVQQVGQ